MTERATRFPGHQPLDLRRSSRRLRR
jgi:hypothetical protein